jgi:hypothetical protein
VLSVAFSPDKSLLAAGAMDGTVAGAFGGCVCMDVVCVHIVLCCVVLRGARMCRAIASALGTPRRVRSATQSANATA